LKDDTLVVATLEKDQAPSRRSDVMCAERCRRRLNWKMHDDLRGIDAQRLD
jgi:hypothetical protein